MVIEVGKPDLYVLLRKRRKSVDQYLLENDVDTTKKLELLYETLEVQHLVSHKFREEAEAYVAKVEQEKKSLAKLKQLAQKQVKPEKKKEEPEKKPKRRQRRSTKTSTSAKSEKDQAVEDSTEE